MKLFSLPVLIGVGGVAAIAVASLIYARSDYTYVAPRKAANASEQVGSAPSTDGAASSGYTPMTTSQDSSNGEQRRNRDMAANGGGNDPQRTAEREQRRQQRMQQMATELGLTDDQKTKMAQIRQTVTDREQRRAAIEAILTPEQKAKMEQMRAERQKNRGANGGGAASGQANGTTPPPQ